MEKIKVGINGFGRIGRLVFRAAMDTKNIDVVAINDLLDVNYMAYMLRYDSVHGPFKGTIAVDGDTLIVNDKPVRVTAEKDPVNLKWNEVGAEGEGEAVFFGRREAPRLLFQKGLGRAVGKVPDRACFTEQLFGGFLCADRHLGFPQDAAFPVFLKAA